MGSDARRGDGGAGRRRRRRGDPARHRHHGGDRAVARSDLRRAGASYEARVFGARSAMPMHQAKRLVGVSAVVLPPRGVVYG
ncbi:hypothetical protein, partial [Mycobacterium avium]|uniref:hypothetical protein n=1 Tax=Mycobacterium avium TaxID=1764 RepID=UPI00373FE3F8